MTGPTNDFLGQLVAPVRDLASVLIHHLGLLASGSFIGIGGWVIAQADAVEAPLEYVGGGILAVTGLVALRMVLTAARHERASATANEGRLLQRILDLEEDLENERREHHLDEKRLDTERRLRLTLEAELAAHGIHDRRDPDPRENPETDTPGV